MTELRGRIVVGWRSSAPRTSSGGRRVIRSRTPPRGTASARARNPRSGRRSLGTYARPGRRGNFRGYATGSSGRGVTSNIRYRRIAIVNDAAMINALAVRNGGGNCPPIRRYAYVSAVAPWRRTPESITIACRRTTGSRFRKRVRTIVPIISSPYAVEIVARASLAFAVYGIGPVYDDEVPTREATRTAAAPRAKVS